METADQIMANIVDQTTTVIQTVRCHMAHSEADMQNEEAKAQERQRRKKLSEEFRAIPAANDDDPEWREIKRRGWPHVGFTLTWDTETFTFKKGQRARIGVYQLRGVEDDKRRELHRAIKDDTEFRRAISEPYEFGVFFNPELITLEEKKAIKSYVENFNKKAREGARDVYDFCYPRFRMMTQQDFVKTVLYKYAGEFDDDLLVVGLNLVFDIGALAVDPRLARRKTWYGGFKIRIAEDSKAVGAKSFQWPAVYVKPLGMKKTRFGWATEAIDGKKRTMKANFLDCSQLGLALLGPGHASMKALAKTLNTKRKKLGRDDYDGAIDEGFLDYAFNDVELTFEIYTKLASRYRDYGITRPIWKIYSEASLGKGVYSDMGVKPFPKTHPEFPASILGAYMATFAGGRSECRIRNKIVEVFHTDFKSQYPTNNELMGLQYHLLAKAYEIRSGRAPSFVLEVISSANMKELRTHEQLKKLSVAAAYFLRCDHTCDLRNLLEFEFGRSRTINTGERSSDGRPLFQIERVDYSDRVWDELEGVARAALRYFEEHESEHLHAVRHFLESITLDDLQFPGTWLDPLMKSIVLIKPCRDILPVRADHGNGAHNISLNLIKSGPKTWWTMADAIASKLLTGKAPAISDAITIYPIGTIDTQPVMGIDPEAEGFFKAVIDKRTDVQHEIAALESKRDAAISKAISEAYESKIKPLSALQLALKLLANSTSYGVLAEVNVDERTGDYSELIEILADDKDVDPDELESAEAERAEFAAAFAVREEEEIGDADDVGAHTNAKKKRRKKKKGFQANIYAGDPMPRHMRIAHFEEPGEFFAPFIATHITAGGRLMLAICERLAADRDLSYAFCDTDSMAFARPDDMSRKDFLARVNEIVNWFAPLYPYKQPAKPDPETPLSILQKEKVNWKPGQKGVHEPLYCVALAAKRYALFDWTPFKDVWNSATDFEREYLERFVDECLDGKAPEVYPLFRKISAHGTGGLKQPNNYEHAMPAPSGELPWRTRDQYGKFEGELLAANPLSEEMLRDLWRKFVLSVESGAKFKICDDRLNTPIIASASMKSREIWDRYDIPDKRPAMFYSNMPKPVVDIDPAYRNEADYKALIERAVAVSYGPSADDFYKLEPHLLHSKDHKPYSMAEFQAELARLDGISGIRSTIRFKTIADFFLGYASAQSVSQRLGYFQKREHTSSPANGTGILKRLSLNILDRVCIGKESNELRDDLAEDCFDEDAGIPTQLFEGVNTFNPSALDGFSLEELTMRDGEPLAAVKRYASGEGEPSRKKMSKLLKAMRDSERGKKIVLSDAIKRREAQEKLRDEIRALGEPWWALIPGEDVKPPKQIESLDLSRKEPGIARIALRVARAMSGAPADNARKVADFMSGKPADAELESFLKTALKAEQNLGSQIDKALRKPTLHKFGTVRAVRKIITGFGEVWSREYGMIATRRRPASRT